MTSHPHPYRWFVVYRSHSADGPWHMRLRYPTRAHARRFVATVRAIGKPGVSVSTPARLLPRRRR